MKITHIYPLLLGNHINPVNFLTENNGRYFWGTDNNTIDPSVLNTWVEQKKIHELKEPVEIEEDEALWSTMDRVWVGVSDRLPSHRIRDLGMFNELILQ